MITDISTNENRSFAINTDTVDKAFQNTITWTDRDAVPAFYRFKDAGPRYVTTDPTWSDRRPLGGMLSPMLSVLPSWEKWPKRMSSVVMSSVSGKTDTRRTTFGNTKYAVYPSDGAMVALAPVRDINTIPGLSNVPYELSGESFHITQMYFPVFGLFQLSKLGPEEAALKFDVWLRRDYDNPDALPDKENGALNSRASIEATYPHLRRLKAAVVADGRSYFEILSEAMDPVRNGYRLLPVEEAAAEASKAGDEFECWTDSRCLLIEWLSCGFLTA